LASIAYASLLMFIFSIPWDGAILLPVVGTGSRVMGIIALPLCLIATVKSGRISFHWPLVLLALFVVFAALSLSWTPEIEGGLIGIQTYVQLLAMTWLVTQMIDGEAKLQGAFMAYILGGGVATVKAIQGYQSESYEKYLRYAAEGMDPNDVAVILSVAIAMAGYLVVCGRNWWWRLIALGFIPLGIYGVLLSASRTGFLAMLIAAGLPFVLMLRPRHYAKAMLFGSVAVVTIPLLLVNYIPKSSWDRITTIESEVSEGTLNGRLAIWAAGLEVINEEPILGTGISGYRAGMQRVAGWSHVPHNVILSIAAQFGVVGLLIVVTAWTLVIRDVLAMPVLERRAWFMFLAVLLMAVMSLNWETQKTTWLLLGLALAHGRFNRPWPSPAAAMVPGIGSAAAGHSVRALHRS
jgi:O-antigen ligase